MATAYKDIVNFSIIRNLREKIGDACIIFNNLLNKDNIARRESEYYEVYTTQYKEDMSNLMELRDRCMKCADKCNQIMLDMNTYNIKQYYLDKDELEEYEDKEDYNNQDFTTSDKEEAKEDNNNNSDDEDIW
jgi:hypothetical protein